MSDFSVLNLAVAPADIENYPPTEAEIQLLREQLKPKAEPSRDYSTLSRPDLLNLIHEKDLEIEDLKVHFKFVIDQAEVELSFARSKFVELVDSMLSLDQEVVGLRELNSSLKEKLEEAEGRNHELRLKYIEYQRDARQNQKLLSEYEENDEARLVELEDKAEMIRALERTLEEEIIYTNELKEINRDQRERIDELRDEIEGLKAKNPSGLEYA
mmetsp:Transcript_672/g.1200  ORF Transcript_672/g.1200 Transcript_672/m.1200 type:complete len:214 (-) Transcript_672:100-741(-)